MRSLLACLLLTMLAAPAAADSHKPKDAPKTPPERKVANHYLCTFDRAWRCRRNGCTIEEDKVQVKLDLVKNQACLLRNGGCRRVLPFRVLTRSRDGFVALAERRRMLISVSPRRTLITENRRSRAYVVWGKCQPDPDGAPKPPQ